MSIIERRAETSPQMSLIIGAALSLRSIRIRVANLTKMHKAICASVTATCANRNLFAEDMSGVKLTIKA